MCVYIRIFVFIIIYLTTSLDIKRSPSINLGFAEVSMREDGIVNTDVRIRDAVSLDQAKEILNAYLKVGNGKKVPHLFTVTRFVIMEKEVMEFASNVANKKGLADAFVIHSLPQKLIGNFYLKFHKPTIPTKLFTSEEKAISWLRSF